MTAGNDQTPPGDPPLDPKYGEMMNGIAEILDEVFNRTKQGGARTTGFVLLVFPFLDRDGQQILGRANYISNTANRAVVVALLKAQVAVLEARMGEGDGS